MNGKAGIATMTVEETTENGNKIVHPMTQEVVAEPKPVVQPCTVGCNASQTIPVGSYANIKVGCHLSVTVEPHEIEEAWDGVSTWVADKLGEMIEQVNEAYGGPTNGQEG